MELFSRPSTFFGEIIVKISNLTIAPKLGILVGVMLLGLCAAGVLAGYFVQREMMISRIEELRHFVAQKLASFKVPVKIVFLPETLPRNPNGKIMKKDLKGLFDA